MRNSVIVHAHTAAIGAGRGYLRGKPQHSWRRWRPGQNSAIYVEGARARHPRSAYLELARAQGSASARVLNHLQVDFVQARNQKVGEPSATKGTIVPQEEPGLLVGRCVQHGVIRTLSRVHDGAVIAWHAKHEDLLLGQRAVSGG